LWVSHVKSRAKNRGGRQGTQKDQLIKGEEKELKWVSISGKGRGKPCHEGNGVATNFHARLKED